MLIILRICYRDLYLTEGGINLWEREKAKVNRES